MDWPNALKMPDKGVTSSPAKTAVEKLKIAVTEKMMIIKIDNIAVDVLAQFLKFQNPKAKQPDNKAEIIPKINCARVESTMVIVLKPKYLPNPARSEKTEIPTRKAERTRIEAILNLVLFIVF